MRNHKTATCSCHKSRETLALEQHMSQGFANLEELIMNRCGPGAGDGFVCLGFQRWVTTSMWVCEALRVTQSFNPTPCEGEHRPRRRSGGREGQPCPADGRGGRRKGQQGRVAKEAVRTRGRECSASEDDGLSAGRECKAVGRVFRSGLIST